MSERSKERVNAFRMVEVICRRRADYLNNSWLGFLRYPGVFELMRLAGLCKAWARQKGAGGDSIYLEQDVPSTKIDGTLRWAYHQTVVSNYTKALMDLRTRLKEAEDKAQIFEMSLDMVIKAASECGWAEAPGAPSVSEWIKTLHDRLPVYDVGRVEAEKRDLRKETDGKEGG